MGQMDEYKLTHTRPTNELEHDDTASPNTKRVLLYGWDGTNKQRVATDTSGLVKIDPTNLDTRYELKLNNSAGLLAALSDETGTGLAVFNNTPSLTTPAIGAATATSIAIGANTLNTSEWANLDGVDQTLATTSTPQFARLGLGVAADATNLLTLANTGKIEFKGGASYTGTLAWNPLGTRAITFPDDSGQLALLNAASGNTWTTKQAFTALPDGTTFSSGSIYINPASATAGYALFGVGVNSIEKFKVDAEGDVTLNSMILGGTTVTTTGTQLNYLNAATGTTGTTSTNLVFSTSPTLVTPAIGAATGTSLSLTNGGITLNTNGQTLTIPYDASRNVVYGSGKGMLLPAGLAGIVGITLTDPATGTQKAYPFNIATSATTGVAFDFLNSRITFDRGGSSTFYVSMAAAGGFVLGLGQPVFATSNTPASATATGVTGTFSWDGSYIYIAVGTNSWKRVAISSW